MNKKKIKKEVPYLRKPFKGGFTPKPKSFVPAAPISLKRIERFNNKHRTVA